MIRKIGNKTEYIKLLLDNKLRIHLSSLIVLDIIDVNRTCMEVRNVCDCPGLVIDDVMWLLSKLILHLYLRSVSHENRKWILNRVSISFFFAWVLKIVNVCQQKWNSLYEKAACVSQMYYKQLVRTDHKD